MAELLVRVVDKINEDFYLNCQCTKRGDVICAQPDGWTWGLEELKNPDWRIIVMPELSLEEAQAMLAPELPVDSKNPPKTLQRRAFKFDLDGLAAHSKEMAAYLTDEKRTSPIVKFVADAKDAGTVQVAIAVDVVKDVSGKPELDAEAKPQPVIETKQVTALAVTATDLLALKVEKEKISDPAIIGETDAAVIG